MSIEGVIEAGGVPTKALSHIEEGNRNLIPFEPADLGKQLQSWCNFCTI